MCKEKTSFCKKLSCVLLGYRGPLLGMSVTQQIETVVDRSLKRGPPGPHEVLLRTGLVLAHVPSEMGSAGELEGDLLCCPL